MTRELPLTFRGHVARILARAVESGGWEVCAEVDGRAMGSELYPSWNLVEQFRDRMQRWLQQAERAERTSPA